MTRSENKVLVGDAKVVQCWDLRSEDPRQPRVIEHQNTVRAVELSPDGRTLITSDGEAVRIWDLYQQDPSAAPPIKAELTEPKLPSPARALAMSPDGRWVAATGLRPQVWDLSKGGQRTALRVPVGSHTSVVFSADSQWLALGNSNGVAHVFRTGQPDPYLVLNANGRILDDLQFIRDQRLFGWCRTERKIKIWELGIDRLLAVGKRMVGRSLTDDERDQIAIDLSNPSLQTAQELGVFQGSSADGNTVAMSHSDPAESRRPELQAAATPVATGSSQPEPGVLGDSRKWELLKQIEVISQRGATFESLADGSLLVRGPSEERDVYEITSNMNASKLIAIRLDALADARMPRRGPGRHNSGNFHLAEISLEVRDKDAENGVRRVRFQECSASHGWKTRPIEHAIDGDLSTVWHVWGERGKSHWACFYLAEPLPKSDVDGLTIRLHHGGDGVDATLGRFRLSILRAPD